MLAWMTAYIVAPVSSVYYPVTILPKSLQVVAWSLPTTHVFEGMRSVLHGNVFPWNAFWWSLILNITYLLIAMAIFFYAFEKSRTKGLSRFE